MAHESRHYRSPSGLDAAALSELAAVAKQQQQQQQQAQGSGGGGGGHALNDGGGNSDKDGFRGWLMKIAPSLPVDVREIMKAYEDIRLHAKDKPLDSFQDKYLRISLNDTLFDVYNYEEVYKTKCWDLKTIVANNQLQEYLLTNKSKIVSFNRLLEIYTPDKVTHFRQLASFLQLLGSIKLIDGENLNRILNRTLYEFYRLGPRLALIMNYVEERCQEHLREWVDSSLHKEDDRTVQETLRVLGRAVGTDAGGQQQSPSPQQQQPQQQSSASLLRQINLDMELKEIDKDKEEKLALYFVPTQDVMLTHQLRNIQQVLRRKLVSPNASFMVKVFIDYLTHKLFAGLHHHLGMYLMQRDEMLKSLDLKLDDARARQHYLLLILAFIVAAAFVVFIKIVFGINWSVSSTRAI